MKKEKPNIFEASDKQNTMENIGQILSINAKDIKTTMNKKKMLFIIGAIVILISLMAGCVGPSGGGGGHYMAISTLDLSWFQRFF